MSSRFLFLLFGEDERQWVDQELSRAGSSASQSMVVLNKKTNAMMENRSPVLIGRSQDNTLLQLSTDVRLAFADSAMTLLSDDDDDDWN